MEWLGKLERAARIAEIENIQAKEYTLKTITKREAKTLFQNFDPVTKNFVTDYFKSKDIRKQPRNVGKYAENVRNLSLNVSFPGRIVGKLRVLFAVDKPNIISDIRIIFDNSLYAYSSNYKIINARLNNSIHKEKNNVEAYHHFVNKVIVDNKTYYIRFTVEELKSKGQLHSAQITEVKIINEKSRESNRSLLENNQGGTAQPAYDSNLMEFLNSVKGRG